MHDSKAISLAKAVSWRATGSVATFFIVYYATGRLELAAIVGGAETFIKIGLFYLHERLWARIATFKLPQRSARANYENQGFYDLSPGEASTFVEPRNI